MSAREEWLDRLDELAAERILGWTWWTWTDKDGQTARLHETMEDPDPLDGLREHVRKNHPDLDEPAETTRYTEGIAEGAEIPRPIWCGGDYTRSISDAWKLVEALLATAGVEFVRLGSDGEDWLLEINPDDPEPLTNYEEHRAPTAPLAITLAALRAVGAQIPEEPDAVEGVEP